MEYKVGTLKRYVVRPGGQVEVGFTDEKFNELGPKVFSQSYIDVINANTKENGKYIVIDEKATEDYHKYAAEERKLRAQRKEEEKALNAALIQRAANVALENITDKKTAKKAKKGIFKSWQ